MDVRWVQVMYGVVEEAPAYHHNLRTHQRLFDVLLKHVRSRKLALRRKEIAVGRQYQALYEQWRCHLTGARCSLHLLRLRLLTFVAYLLSVHQYLLCLSLGPMLSTLLLQLRFLTCVICLLCFIFEDYHPFCVSNAWAHALSLACMLSAVLHLCNPGTCVKVAVMHCMLCSKLY